MGNWPLFNAGVYIFLFDPPQYEGIWPNNMLGGKNYWKGMKKGGKKHIFSPIGKKYAYFFPNWLKIYKIEQKKVDKVDNFIRGTIINQEGGGQKYEYEFNIHPWFNVQKNLFSCWPFFGACLTILVWTKCRLVTKHLLYTFMVMIMFLRIINKFSKSPNPHS